MLRTPMRPNVIHSLRYLRHSWLLVSVAGLLVSAAHSAHCAELHAEAPRELRTRASLDASPGALPLRLSDELSTSAEASDLARDLWRIEQRALQSRNDRSDSPQALSEKITRLETDLKQLNQAGERLQRATAASSAPPQNSPGAAPGAVVAQGAVVPQAAVAAQAAAVVPGAAQAAKPPLTDALPAASREQLPSEIAPRPARARAGMDTGELAVYAGLTGAALLVFLLVFRRQPAPPVPAKERPAPRVLRVPTNAPAPANREPTPVRAAQVQDSLPIAAPVVTIVPAPPAPSELPPAERTLVLPAEFARFAADPELSDAGPALELADVMMSFGRVAGAAKTLEEYVLANPKEALRPWIRLLQIYQQSGQRDEFEALSLKLNRNFNVEIIRWESDDIGGETGGGALELLPLGEDQGRALTLEQLPHLREKIVSLWGKPECLGYLQALLHENRDGQRSGFPMPVVEELLFLIDLIAARSAATALH